MGGGNTCWRGELDCGTTCGAKVGSVIRAEPGVEIDQGLASIDQQLCHGHGTLKLRIESLACFQPVLQYPAFECMLHTGGINRPTHAGTTQRVDFQISLYECASLLASN